MQRKLLLATLILMFLSTLFGFSQTDGTLIDYVGSTRDNSAVLDVRSSTQGFLAPRLTTTQRTGISSPANGLLVYDTQLDKFYYYDAALGWTPLSTSTGTITAVTADNGLTSSGGNTPNIQLGGTPLNQNTEIVQGNNDMVFDMTGTGVFEVKDNVNSALYIKNDGTVGINTNSPEASAILDLVSTGKGVLFPRMTVAQRNAIPTPANSLIIYNTTSRCLEIFTDNAWQSFYCSCPVLDPLRDIVGPDPVCSGSTVSFSVPGVTGAADYSWTVSGVAPGSITGNGGTTVSFPAPGSNTFTVSVTASNACNNSLSSKTTTVNAYTAVPPTPTAASSPSAICQAGTYNYSILNGLGINGTTAVDYTWTVTTTGTASATLTANSQTATAGSPVTYTSIATAVTLNIGASGSGNVTVSVVGNNTCGASGTPRTWTLPVNILSADPTSATASASTICSGQSTTLTLNGGGGGTGEVIRWYTSSCGGTLVGSGNNLSVSPTTSTTYYGRYEDPAPCSYNTACQSVSITLEQLSVAPTTISGPTGICDGSSATLSVSGGSLGTGAIIEWFTGSCGGTSAGTGSSITVSPTSNTTYYVRYNGNCNTTTCATVSVTVDQFTTASAGSDQAVCATTATLAGNTPATGGGTWTLVSGSGTITTPSSPTSGITGLGVGANVFRWTLLNGGCADSQDQVTITGQSSSVTPTGISGTTSICTGASTTLSVTGGSAGTGAVVEWFTGSCGGTSAGTGTSISVTPTSNTTYYVRYSGNCNTTTCASQLISVDQFTTASAGSDQSVCSTTATLAGNTPATGAGTWTLASGSGTITTPSSPTSGITALGVGANVFRWTLPNGGCTDSQDEVTITGQNSSVIPTGISGTTTICNGSSTTLTVSGGTAGTGAVAEWFTGSCNGTAAGTGPSISVSPTSSTTYYVRYNGACNTTACVSQLVTVGQFTASNAGPDQTLCATTATLAGNTPATGGGTWTLVSGAGTITTPSSPTSGITALGVGPNVFRWTLLNGGCTDSQDEVTITGEQFTTSAAGSDQTVCSNSATLAGNTPATGNGTWTLISGSGTIISPNTPSSSITSLGLGANQFRWTLPNGSCPDSQDDVIITSHQFTASSAGSDQTLCATSATLAGNTPATGGGTWTLVSGTGSITTPTSPSSGVTGLGVGANTFRWTLLNGVCTVSQDDVVITSDQFTTSNAGPDQAVCATTATLAGNTPASGSGTWTLVGGSGSITTSSSPSSGVTGLGVGANTFRWTLDNGSCTNSTNDVVITRNVPSTDPTSITGTLSIASGTTTTLTVSGGGGGTNATAVWYTGSCGGTQVGTGASYTTASLTSDTQYWVRYQDDCGNSNCATATVTVTSGCTHTLRMFDSWGDGWNGASVDVFVNGALVADDASIGGSQGDATFLAATGDNITFTWVSGSYNGEISWVLFDGFGTNIASGAWGNNPSATGACPPPNACPHTFNLFDSWGDGWNGAEVDLNVNGSAVLSRAVLINGAAGSLTFWAATGDNITLSNWVSGSYDGEISWSIQDGGGTVIGSGAHGATPAMSGNCP